MSTFVDIGWGVDSVQTLLPSLSEFAQSEAAMVNTKTNLDLTCIDCSATFASAGQAKKEKEECHEC